MAYNQAPLKNIGDIRENIAKRKANRKLGIENQPSAFVEVVREKGFKESISNPRTTKREIQQTRIDRLKATQAAKPKRETNTFSQVQKIPGKYEKIDGKKVLVEAPRYEKFSTTSLNDDKSDRSIDFRDEIEGTRQKLTPKETRTYLKATRSTSTEKYHPWIEMRKDIKKSRPDYKGKDASKRRKEAWKDKAGGTGGRKNAIKNSYGFGFVPQQGAQPGFDGKIHGGSSGNENKIKTSQGGVCTQDKMLAGGCK